MKAIIVGSGIGGLSTSIRLAAAGYEVEVFEASEGPGGKLKENTIDGYRFDLGPSLFTMPHLVEELFVIAGEKMSDHFQFQQLETICNYFYEDGARFHSYSDVSKLEEELKQKAGLKTGELKKYLKTIKHIYDITAPIFLYKSLHRIASFLNLQTIKSILQLPFIRSSQTMNEMNKAFFSDPRLVQYFNRYATYNGSNPYQAPGTLNLIPHLEHDMGAYFPKGGMYSITKKLYELACRKGVLFHFNQPVSEIIIENKIVKGVKLNKGLKYADIVISNMDIYPTYRKLLSTYKAPEHLLKQKKSSSALIFYWGISKSFPELDLHNILFSADYKKEFDAIWNSKTIHSDPTVYINITSKYEASDAPEGCENWFVMINVPHNSGQDWDQLKKDAREFILKKINRMLKTDIEPFIQTEDFLDPVLIETRTSSYKGALYGNASNNKMAAFLRHSNARSDIRGLYFCGGSVHPGGGIPLAILSGKITAELIMNDLPC